LGVILSAAEDLSCLLLSGPLAATASVAQPLLAVLFVLPLPDPQGYSCLLRGYRWVTNETKTRSKNSGQGRPR